MATQTEGNEGTAKTFYYSQICRKRLYNTDMVRLVSEDALPGDCRSRVESKYAGNGIVDGDSCISHSKTAEWKS
jgi:hypothetical protein